MHRQQTNFKKLAKKAAAIMEYEKCERNKEKVEENKVVCAMREVQMKKTAAAWADAKKVAEAQVASERRKTEQQFTNTKAKRTRYESFIQ